MAKLMSDLMRDAPAVADQRDEDEAFEGIEAPMFVDLADPDRSRHDDPSWFCTRIGCDQNHEQVDPKELERNFRLRVLAARSPNVRLHKALHRRQLSPTQRCPQSAPVKPPRSRIARLCSNGCAADETLKERLKNHPVNGLSATPRKADKPLATPASKIPRAPKEAMKVAAAAQPESRTPMRKREVASRYLLNTAKSSKSARELAAKSSLRKEEPEICTEKKPTRLWRKWNPGDAEDDDNDKENAPQPVINENVPPKVAELPKKTPHRKTEQKSKIQKTTNPRPFRLRTDERRILKDANSEHKQQKNDERTLKPKPSDVKKKLNSIGTTMKMEQLRRPASTEGGAVDKIDKKAAVAPARSIK